MVLRTRGGGRVSWDEMREWHGHIYTPKCKIDSWWEAAAQGRSDTVRAEGQKIQIKLLAGLMSPEDMRECLTLAPSLACRQPSSPCVLHHFFSVCVCLCIQISPYYKDPGPIALASTVMTPLSLQIPSAQTLPPNQITFRDSEDCDFNI